MDLDDLIMYENETTSLDFKSIQYKKEQNESMIKDVMSMANANIDNERYIIMGIKHQSSGERDILGIEKSEFVDDATYQQIILENIEPDINIKYFSHEHNEKFLGIIKISNCNEQPYMMKKDYRKLRKGDSFIRKGSQQSKMDRKDFERIYSKRKSKDDFNGKVKLGFDDQNFAKEIGLKFIEKPELPSERAKKEIEEALSEKKQEAQLEVSTQYNKMLNTFNSVAYPFGGRPYNKRSIEDLEKCLLEVKSTYYDDDYYEVFELNSNKLNIYIYNQGNNYIEDSSIEVKIEKIDGLLIANEIYEKPSNDNLFLPRNIGHSSLDVIKYPDVREEGSVFIISQEIGNIKHHIITKAFFESIRVVLTSKAKNQTLKLTCKIFGKNLTTPLVEELKIKVIDLLGE